MGYSSLRRHVLATDLESLAVLASDVTPLRSMGFQRVQDLYGMSAAELLQRAQSLGVPLTSETILRILAGVANHKLGIRYGRGGA